MITNKKMTRLALGKMVFLFGLTAGAASEIPNLGTNASTALGAQFCVECAMNDLQTKLLLEPVYYFEDPRKIQTLPRTANGRGSAGELGLAGIGAVKATDRRGATAIGTSFLVSPCHVLTNYHVAFHWDMQHPSSAVRVYFYYGQGNDGSFATHTSASPVDHPELDVHGWGDRMHQTVGAQEDWVLLRLNKCVSKEYGYLSLLPATAASAIEKILRRLDY